MNNAYSIYKLTFSDGKTYIGQTKLPVNERWKNGQGYQDQEVYVPIILEGWDNIQKEVLHTNLTQEQANELEKYYIKKFNSIKNGYNRNEGGSQVYIKDIEINIQDDYFYNFLKQKLSQIKPNALKLLMYFFFHNHQEIQFLPSKITTATGMSSKNTCYTAFKQLVELNILTQSAEEQKYELTIKA